MVLLTSLLFIPQGRQNDIKTLISAGKYEEAQELIDKNDGYGESDALDVLCEAGEAFENLDYEKGIKEICSIGGSVTIYYDSNGTTIDKESEIITNFDSINNSIYKEGYKNYNWVLIDYSIDISKHAACVYLKAEFNTALKYSITCELYNGTFKSLWNHWYTVESEDKTIPNPTKKGYTFLGWTSENITTPTKDLVIKSGSSGNITLISNWQPNAYTITYDINTGNALETNTQIVTYGESFTMVTPTKTGYKFLGWYNGENLIKDGTWNITSNVTLKASWEILSYSITYIGVEGADNSANSLTYTYNEATITLQDPTKTGYTFLGWTTTEVLIPTKNLTIVHNSIGNKEFVANWQANTYTITYDVNTGNALDSNTQSVTYNSVFTLIFPTKTEYTFEGWYNENVLVQDGIWNIASDVTLKARWKIISYNITYNGVNGADNSINPNNYTYETDTITLQNPSRAGSEFLGWTTSNSITPTKNLTITKNSTGDKEFTANWKVYYTYVDSTKTSLYFGLYPQTKVSDDTLISTLNAKTGTLPTSSNTYNWKDYGYYISGSVSSYMYYIDIDNDNNGMYDYRGVYFTQYRPSDTSKTSLEGNSYQDDNGYNINTVYWFKYEPIKWNILKTEDGKALIIADLIVDSQDYYYSDSSRSGDTDYQGNTTTGKVYANNYMYSYIRSWLNETFYTTAFNTLEKEIIETTIVDNSVSSTDRSFNTYISSDTNDKIFLLSYKEVVTYYSLYGERRTAASDYAKCQGLYVYYLNYSCYWLRTPSYDHDEYAGYVGCDAAIYYDICSVNAGVRPACWISLIN